MRCSVCHGDGISPGSWRIGGLACGACGGSGWLPDDDDDDDDDDEGEAWLGGADTPGAEERPTAAAAAPSGDSALIRSLFGTLEGAYERDKASGVVDATAAHGLDHVLRSLGVLVDRSGREERGLDEMQRERDRLNDLMRDMLNRVRRPSFTTPEPAPGGRAARVLGHLQEIKAALGADGLRMRRADGEHDKTFDLYLRLARLTSALHAAAGDPAAFRRLEMDDARSLMDEARWYARRHNLTLARPVWSREVPPRDPNLVFFNGPDAVRRRLTAPAEALGLRLSPAGYPGADVGAARWRDLAAAGLAVFDLTAREPQLYYDLGVALALGTELLLLTESGTRIEFDVAQEVRTYADHAELDRLLPEALDAALYGVGAVRGGAAGADSSLAASVAEAERLAAARPGDALLGISLRQVRSAAEDPVGLRAAMGAFVGFLGAADAPALLYPRWPAAYPSPSERRCFIAMPFRRHLEPTRDAVQMGCLTAGCTPVRGDAAAGQEIIASIWEEIGRATHLVVDLTDLNLNVCLELGIADALGRPTLLIGRDGTDRRRLASVAKRRLHAYAAGAEKARLVPLVRQFVGAAAAGALPRLGLLAGLGSPFEPGAASSPLPDLGLPGPIFGRRLRR